MIGRYLPSDRIIRGRTSGERMEASPERISRHYTKLSLTCVRPLRTLVGNFNVIGGGCVRI